MNKQETEKREARKERRKGEWEKQGCRKERLEKKKV